ncbi:MAG: adenylyl-sulfate kinase, partial [Alphaproteobacteria bacterium 13_1_20CM_4_65_11]
EESLIPGRSYWLKLGTRTVAATVTTIKHGIDVDTGAHLAAHTLGSNEIGFCNISTATPVAFDPYDANRETGGFILIDRFTQETAAAGMIAFALRRASNIHWQDSTVTPGQRAQLKGQQPAVLWFTGLSGAGKSTIANRVEQKLAALGCHTMLLDGDNVRHGLNRDLGFTDADRVENIRRVAEAARLMAEAGLVAICAFISPFRADRQMARDIAAPHPFIEVFVDTPIEECMRRDPKGLYAKARAGARRQPRRLDAVGAQPLVFDRRGGAFMTRQDGERLDPGSRADPTRPVRAANDTVRTGLSRRPRTRSMVEDRTVEPYRFSRGHAEPQAAAVAGPDRRPVAAAAEGRAAGRMPRQAPLESRRQSARCYGFFWQCQTSVFSRVVWIAQ